LLKRTKSNSPLFGGSQGLQEEGVQQWVSAIGGRKKDRVNPIKRGKGTVTISCLAKKRQFGEEKDAEGREIK